MEAECKPRRKESQQSTSTTENERTRKQKQNRETPHDHTNPAPPGLGGRSRVGRGAGFRTVRSDPPPSARRPPTHGVKMGEKGMFS